MAEDKRPKKKGLFGRKKKKKDTESAGSRSVSTQGDASASTLDSALKSSGSSSGKKKGFGSRIKRMVGGRKRSSKKSKDDDSTGVSFMDPTDPNYKGPRTALDPDILAKVMEEEEYPTGSSGQKPFGGHPGGPGGGGLGRSPHSMARNMGHEEDEDEDVFDDRMSYGEEEDEYNSAENEPGDLNGPMSLVLLLVDPDTLRFELLQLEFETVQGAKVADVLDQIINSVTEPAIRTLEFHALVDRKGNPFSANTALPKAVTNRRRSKDILVGLSKGVTVEHCGRLARPILGDAKVIAMLEVNGYDVRGWAKDKKDESKVPDVRKETFRATERKRQLKWFGILGGFLLILYVLYHGHAWYFDKNGSLPLPVQKLVDTMGLEQQLTTTTTTNTTTTTMGGEGTNTNTNTVVTLQDDDPSQKITADVPESGIESSSESDETIQDLDSEPAIAVAEEA